MTYATTVGTRQKNENRARGDRCTEGGRPGVLVVGDLLGDVDRGVETGLG